MSVATAVVVTSIPPAASASPGDAMPVPAVLEHIELRPATSPTVVFQLSTPTRLVARTLAADAPAPDRIYIDLTSTHLGRASERVVAGTGPLRRVRSGQFDPNTVRVVLDLEHPMPFTVRQEGTTVVVSLETQGPLLDQPIAPVTSGATPGPSAAAVEAPPSGSPLPPPAAAATPSAPPRSPLTVPPAALSSGPAPAAPAASQPLFDEPPPPVAGDPALPAPAPDTVTPQVAASQPTADVLPGVATDGLPDQRADAVPAASTPAQEELASSAPAPAAEPVPETPPAIASAPPPEPPPATVAEPAALPPTPPSRSVAPATTPSSLPVIVLDAGHGGRDQGATGIGGVLEKDVVLELTRRVALRLATRLPVTVLMTRTEDTFLPIEGRLATTGDGVALFLSLHANSCPDPAARGVELFYGGGTLRPASTHSADPRAVLLGQCLADALRTRVGQVRRDPRPGSFGVLARNSAPSVLVEIGFLTHPADAALAQDTGHQELMADALVDGIVAFLRASSPPL